MDGGRPRAGGRRGRAADERRRGLVADGQARRRRRRAQRAEQGAGAVRSTAGAQGGAARALLGQGGLDAEDGLRVKEPILIFCVTSNRIVTDSNPVT